MAFITAETRSELVALSVAMLKQAPSNALLDELIGISVAGGTIADAAAHIAKTAAFKAEYPSFQTAAQYAAEIFDAFAVGGTVTAELRTEVIDLASGLLTSGAYDKASLAAAISSFLLAPAALENAGLADMAQSFQNRSAAAEYYVITKELGGKTDAELAAAISSVTSDAATLTASKAATDAAAVAVAVVPGKTFTLTTSSDPVTGGAGDDSIIGVIGTNALTASGTTLQAGDALNLGAGTDTLSVSIAGTHTGATNTTTVSFTDIEKIQVSNYETSTNNDTIDLSLATGLETVALYGSIANGDVAFTGAKNILASEMWNGAGDLSVGYAATAVAGTTDVASLTLSGATAGTFTSAGVETLNITSAGTNALTSVASAYKAVNISGGKLTLGNLGTTATVAVDATEQTGKLTAVLAGTGTLNVKLGSGGSAITANADTLTKADTITGGAGADTLTVNTASLTNAILVGVTGVETLDYEAASSITLTKPTDFTTFDFDNANNQSLVLSTGYTGAVTVDITGDTASADSITNTANVAITVKGGAGDFAAATDINGSATAVETLLIKADGNTAAITGAGAIDAIDVITIVDGTTAGTDVTIDVNAYGTALTIDATALDAGTTAASADNEVLTISNISGKALNVKGGGGPDVIQDSASNDTIEGNGGNDVITADQGGVDTIKGGDGNDTINMGATLTAADTIDGGDGTDTVNVTSLTAAALAGITNVETLGYTAAGALSLAADLSFDAISLEGANDTALTFATGYTKAMTVSVEDGDSVTNTAKIALTITADDDELAAADNTILAGSTTAVDTLNILNKTASGTVDMQTDISNFDVVNILDFATTAGNDITIDVTGHGGSTGTLTIDASALDAGTTAASADNEVFVMTGAATASLRVTGGSAGDTIVLGTGKDIINAGAGNDTLTAGTNATYEDTIDGGDGTDTIAATAAVDIDFQNTSNVEVLSATTSAVLANFAQTAGVRTVSLVGAATLNASGMTSGVTVVAPAATTNAAGSLGDDTFVFQATETLTAADTINGVAGYDTIRLDNDDNADKAGDAVAATMDASVTNIDRVLVNDIASADTNGDVTVTLAASFAQKTLEIDGSALDLGETLTVVAGSNLAAEVVTVKGGAGADTITTGAGADTITGGSGADFIDGNAGADTITGGAGSDTFSYATGDSTSAKTDTITDLTTTVDQIRFTHTATGGNVSFTDMGDAASITDGLSLLSGVQGQYYFDKTNGKLAIDVDGNGLIQVTDTIINLTGLTAFSSVDMDVVVTATDAAGTITTGSGNDRITGVVGNKANVYVGGAGNDTYLMIDAGEVDVFVETATGGTDTLVTGAALDIAGYKFGTTAAGATANGALTNFENLVLKQGATFTADASNFSGVTINVNTDAAGVLTIAAPGPTTGTNTLDFGGITGTATTYLDATGATATGVALDAADILTITGGSGVDTITVAPLIKNNITAAGGIDLITLGTGVDTVITASAAADKDTITGFTSGSDVIDASAPLGAATLTVPTQVDSGAAANATAAIALVTTDANTDRPVYYFKNTGTGVLTLTQIETAITAGSAATGEAVIALDNGSQTDIYFDLAAQTDAGSGGGMILVATLVGVTGATGIATGDLISS